jgi:hypothetical protein
MGREDKGREGEGKGEGREESRKQRAESSEGLVGVELSTPR